MSQTWADGRNSICRVDLRMYTSGCFEKVSPTLKANPCVIGFVYMCNSGFNQVGLFLSTVVSSEALIFKRELVRQKRC